MVLIRVDLPQPSGPRTQKCSPTSMRSDTSSSAGRSADSPRTTVTFCKAKSGGGVCISDSGKTRNYLNRARFEGKELREGARVKPFKNVTRAIHVAPFDM